MRKFTFITEGTDLSNVQLVNNLLTDLWGLKDALESKLYLDINKAEKNKIKNSIRLMDLDLDYLCGLAYGVV